MLSFGTVEEARATAGDNVTLIVEIEPGMPGVGRYIRTTCQLRTLADALRSKPIPEIKRIIGVAADLAQERYDNEQSKIHAAVPGLDILRAARHEWDVYHEDFNRSFDREDGCCNRPRKPASDPDAIAIQYPIAAAYLRAEGFSLAAHHAKAGAGSRATERIVSGEDYMTVIREMESEWTTYATNNVD